MNNIQTFEYNFVDKMLKFGFYLFALSLFSTKSGLDISVTIISLSFLIIWLRNKKIYDIYPSKFLKQYIFLTIFFLFLCLVSIFISVDRISAIKRFVIIIGYFGLFYGVMNIRNINFIKKIINIIIYVGIFETLVCALQIFFGFDILGRKIGSLPDRAMGTLGYPNDLGIALGIFLPFITAVMWNEKNIKKKILYVISFLILCFCLILTKTRGAWIGMVMGLVFMGFLRNRKIILLIILIVSLFLSLPVTRERLKQTTVQNNYTRIRFFKDTIVLILQKPILGWGLDNFKTVYYSKYPESVQEIHFHPHNVYLNIAFQVGFLGLLIFLSMFFVIIKFFIVYLYKTKDEFTKTVIWGSLGSIVDFFVHGVVDEPFRAYQGPYVLFFILGVTFWCIHKRSNEV